ncbi:hypothetical protein [Candidatus Reidiella endopervernicosa]|uniref:Uncharacterized protein n=2 Tax=Candidatus Reidiella endopervernicosa TaxID=2738883 RepID=A0A6N0HY65_9GAMM|nr:hypothetical protein [Candidatus Reidiella endopervernicosa]QKQ27304.1 hypothetical protein HUE57_14190 [Candidatus Reidiella endopervernicosa]
MFWASKPKQTAKTSRDRLCLRRPTSCVRCVITSSRLYTTPSVTLRRHKAAAASSPSFARALNYEYQTASTIGANRLRFAILGGQRLICHLCSFWVKKRCVLSGERPRITARLS